MTSIFERAQRAVRTTAVYGEPYETPDGATVITVARVRGLPGGEAASSTPVGVFVVHQGEVTWRAAVDESRIARLGLTIGLVSATLGTLAVLRRPPWPDLRRFVD
ncbi:hypothetical protein ACWDUM_18120 [Rhodococcus sp. NPDC003322]